MIGYKMKLDSCPFCGKTITGHTVRKIIKMYKKGYTVFKIGSSLKVELRAVRSIIKKNQAVNKENLK